MRLQNFYQASNNAQENGNSLDYGVEAIAADQELATHIQEVLVWLQFLDPPVDGKFGPISTDALIEFQDTISEIRSEVAQERGFLGLFTAKALIEISPEEVPRPNVNYSRNDLAARLMKYMAKMNYRISVGDRRYNIVYVEGMNTNGSLNNDAPNQFNDRRMVIEIPDSDLIPIIQGNWEATTEPGTYYTNNPMGRGRQYGAARIAFGQYKAWRVGTHYGSGADPHEALVQKTPISVYRDKNRDMIRTGDFLDTGKFHINQHWGYDLPRTNIGMAGAGCLVGRLRKKHKDFMALIKQDKRYQRNNNYLFLTTIIPGDKFVEQFPPS
ncbi:peptidoglycan-binding domain-containing protein [Coleofasciculus chthonoplastes]|uniref:peptidoglycan-binding domain-containing protein n=1 Tax=Coleofasciculus chthonoplastes TaxID=64178 RepID=UPI0032F531CE